MYQRLVECRGLGRRAGLGSDYTASSHTQCTNDWLSVEGLGRRAGLGSDYTELRDQSFQLSHADPSTSDLSIIFSCIFNATLPVLMDHLPEFSC